MAVVLYVCWTGQLPSCPARSFALVNESRAEALLTTSGEAARSVREEPAPGGLVVEHGHELEARPFDVDVVPPRLSPMPQTPHRLQLLYFPECPHWRLAEQRLGEVAARVGLSIEHQLVTTEEEAERVSFRGSPTILIDGVDPFAEGDQAIGLSCRIYLTPDGYAGSPTLQQIAAVLDRE